MTNLRMLRSISPAPLMPNSPPSISPRKKLALIYPHHASSLCDIGYIHVDGRRDPNHARHRLQYINHMNRPNRRLFPNECPAFLNGTPIRNARLLFCSGEDSCRSSIIFMQTAAPGPGQRSAISRCFRPRRPAVPNGPASQLDQLIHDGNKAVRFRQLSGIHQTRQMA